MLKQKKMFFLAGGIKKSWSEAGERSFAKDNDCVENVMSFVLK